MDGRAFGDGSDSRWTALDAPATGNKQINYYNSSLAATKDGKLHIQLSPNAANYTAGTYDASGRMVTYTKPIQSAMLQSWNKFCFTGGIVELHAKMPGAATQPGLWPAFCAWLCPTITLPHSPWRAHVCKTVCSSMQTMQLIRGLPAA